MKTELYLVGEANAHETNRWLAMTNDQEKAVQLLRELDASQMKTITVEEVKRDVKRN